VEDTGKAIRMDKVSLYPVKRAVTVNGGNISLTYKEFELLQLLMENRGTVFSRDSIMSRIWHTDSDGKTRTVDMHIKTLRKKLGLSGNIVKTIRGAGYKVGN